MHAPNAVPTHEQGVLATASQPISLERHKRTLVEVQGFAEQLRRYEAALTGLQESLPRGA